MNSQNIVTKSLDRYKAIDAPGMANELFKNDAAGTNFLLAKIVSSEASLMYKDSYNIFDKIVVSRKKRNARESNMCRGNRVFADLRYVEEDSISPSTLNFPATKG